MMSIVSRTLLLAMIVWVQDGLAQDGPDQVIREAIAELSQVNQRKNVEDLPRILMTEVIFPRSDLMLMSKLAVGSSPWGKASDGDKAMFIENFRERLIIVFHRALAAYEGEQIEIASSRQNADRHTATVTTSVPLKGGNQSEVIFAVRFKPEDGWKVYDVVIDGTSLVTGYRADLLPEVNEAGVSGAAESLVGE